MANEWKQIAEVYRNREHALLAFIKEYIHNNFLTLEDLVEFYEKHLATTGRTADSPLDTPPISQPDEDTRKRLLALLAPSEAELGAVLPRPPSLTKSGKPRKQRSDKGKPRGKRKVD